ncbi:MAG: hypothetical protein A2381_07110 [Bdellovibrionales bacterium RIFOXYB1_FULL_37_110]|nr:MAG: hypothetical protein A2417_14985 [Bdellovibrionales bacterium RIFOXYC1_FULL_37_79]OFZ57831.1 MAG: hypothetical protein A2381_07110 [Bdellovibrionales bacterium RIFOXYB1_FULL_37_110]OFZ62797.1 MAG: hypothetical protein A2577_16630 [Bdellovibrionales bacterium RIFOXYD1_FULL_36_51]
MKLKTSLISILTFMLSLSTYAFFPWAQGPMKEGKSNSGVVGASYKSVVDILTKLEKKYPELVTLDNLGQTADRQNMYGVILRRKNIPTKKMIYISGATHGDEYLNIADRLINAFLDDTNEEFYSFYERGGAFMVIPIFNPYGYTKRVRYNSASKDLNRDYSNPLTGVNRFTQKETQMSVQWIDQFLSKTSAQFVLSMDYHCCFNGALLQPWSHTETPIAPPDRLKQDMLGDLLKKQFDDALYGPVTDILWYAPDGTSMDYFYGKYGTIAGVYEARYGVEASYINKHVAWFKDIVGEFAKE